MKAVYSFNCRCYECDESCQISNQVNSCLQGKQLGLYHKQPDDSI